MKNIIYVAIASASILVACGSDSKKSYDQPENQQLLLEELDTEAEIEANELENEYNIAKMEGFSLLQSAHQRVNHKLSSSDSELGDLYTDYVDTVSQLYNTAEENINSHQASTAEEYLEYADYQAKNYESIAQQELANTIALATEQEKQKIDVALTKGLQKLDEHQSMIHTSIARLMNLGINIDSTKEWEKQMYEVTRNKINSYSPTSAFDMELFAEVEALLYWVEMSNITTALSI